jgi:hypothetical protein
VLIVKAILVSLIEPVEQNRMIIVLIRINLNAIAKTQVGNLNKAALDMR